MQTIHQRRRSAWYSWPLILLLVVVPSWIFIFSFQQLTHGLNERDSVLHIQSGVVILPLISITMMLLLALDIARCIPCDSLADKLEIWFMRLLFATLILIPFVLIGGTLIQNHYLPKMGYSKCTDLMHNRSMLANYWIKPTDLCVSGKTVDWVREQAAKRASGAASQASPEVNTSK
jgi:heme A synthase